MYLTAVAAAAHKPGCVTIEEVLGAGKSRLAREPRRQVLVDESAPCSAPTVEPGLFADRQLVAASFDDRALA